MSPTKESCSQTVSGLFISRDWLLHAYEYGGKARKKKKREKTLSEF